jgi:hypothetical protein
LAAKQWLVALLRHVVVVAFKVRLIPCVVVVEKLHQ